MNQVMPRGSHPYVFRSAAMRGLMRMVDGFGSMIAKILTFGRGLQADPAILHDPKKILVVRMDHIGDVLFCRPALQMLREMFPNASITLLTSRAGADLLAHDTRTNEIIAWDAPWFSRGQRSGQSSWWSLLGKLRRAKYDLSLDLRGDLRHHILLFLAGVRIRAGYTITGGGFLLHIPCRLPVHRHEVERNLFLVAQTGRNTTMPEKYQPIHLTAEETAQGDADWKDGQRRIVVHPSAGDPAKQWLPEQFAKVCDQLTEKGFAVVLIGTDQERRTSDLVLAKLQHRVTDWTGKTRLRQLAALLSGADGFIGNDSGPAHLAIVQGCPAVMIWSETNAPEEWGPWGKDVAAEVVRRSTPDQEIAQTLEAVDKLFLKMVKKRQGC